MKLIRSFLLIIPMLAPLAACAPDPTAGETDALGSRSSALKSTVSATSTANVDPNVSQVGSTCTCTETYRSGRTKSVTSCKNASSDCADLERLEDCDGRSDGTCDLLTRCDCDCAGVPSLIFDHSASDGVYLTGIPDLWQFDYMCGASPNAIGCGPIAMSSMFYWWAERGFSHLVDDHLTTGGLQSWKDLAKELRRDYASGICIGDVFTSGSGGEYAMLESSLEKNLAQYPKDKGYSTYVNHYRVCDDCNVDGLTDLNESAALDKIKDELEGGRPVIMGFNTGTAFSTSVKVDGEIINTGALSVGVGWIDHYGVITGYRRTSDGRDVVYMNTGLLDTGPDIALEWKPAGKWVHLFTLSVPGKANGTGFCPLDTSIDQIFAAASDVEVSHAGKIDASPTREFTAMAGAHCGVARDGKHVFFTPRWTENTKCVTLHDFDVLDQTVQDNLPGGLGTGSAPLDHMNPL